MPGYLEFEVSLLELKPRVWRQFLLRATANFRDLNDAIQLAGPWEGHHLWQFAELGRPRRAIASLPNPEIADGAADARLLKLEPYFQHYGDRVLYRYDFGDDWEHEVTYVRPHELKETFQRRLVAGERAFPPEDCGSAPGYYECLAAVGQHRYPKGERHPSAADLAERRKWLRDWTPEFDLESAKRRFDR